MNGPRRSLAALLFLPFAAVALPEAAFERGGVTFVLTDEMMKREIEVRRPVLRREAEADAAYERGSFEKKGTSSDKDLPVI